MKLNPPTASRDFIRPKGGFHHRRCFHPPERVDLVEKNGNRITITVLFWQRMRDSNPRKRSQSPVCYRYTNPLFRCSQATSLLYSFRRKSQALFSNFRKISPGNFSLPGETLFYSPSLRITAPMVWKIIFQSTQKLRS